MKSRVEELCSQIISSHKLDMGDREAARKHTLELIQKSCPLDSPATQEMLLEETLSNLWGLGSIEALFKDPQISEIMINAGEVWIEKAGFLERTSLELDGMDIQRLIERILAPLGLRVDRMSPQVDARLLDGSRVHIILPPLAIDGPHITIRRFLPRDFTLQDFLPDACGGGKDRKDGRARKNGTSGKSGKSGVANLLKWAVLARANIIVSGGTSSGKTTLLNVLAKDLKERIITIEDTAELALSAHHTLRLETRQANAEGVGLTTQRDLVRSALRMRPDRVIVGEVRGPEALDMLQAMNTGNEGSMTSCHANSARDTLSRLETMVLMANSGLSLAAVKEQILSALDLIIYLKRTPKGERNIDSIAELSAERGFVILADREGMRELPQTPPRDLSVSLPQKEWLKDSELEDNEQEDSKQMASSGFCWK